jgi:hypothetical protein
MRCLFFWNDDATEPQAWLSEGLDPKEVHEKIRLRSLENGRKMQAQMAAAGKGLSPAEQQARMKKMYVGLMRKNLPAEYMSDAEFEAHFTPKYDWDL